MRTFIRLALGASLLAACSASNGSGTDAGSATNPEGGGGGGDDGGAAGRRRQRHGWLGTGSDGGGPGDTGTGTDGGGGPGDTGTKSDGGTSVSFRAITLPGSGERVTGAYCSDAHTCVVTTNPFGDAGHIYSSDGNTITGTLVTGDDTYAAMFNTTGTVSFLGVSSVGGKVVARVIDAEEAFVTATGPITSAASWTGVVGASNGGDFGINAQYGIGTNGTRWTLVSAGRVWEAPATPGPTTAWTNVFSPQAVPPIPANIADLRTADPTLCDTDPTISVSPDLAQEIYVAADGSLIVSPSGSVNQAGDDTAGVCISVDGGHTFHHAEFTGVAMGLGPMENQLHVERPLASPTAASRATPARSTSTSPNNASQGATSTWTKATTPARPGDTELRAVAFAPDGKTGWLVGSNARGRIAPADDGEQRRDLGGCDEHHQRRDPGQPSALGLRVRRDARVDRRGQRHVDHVGELRLSAGSSGKVRGSARRSHHRTAPHLAGRRRVPGSFSAAARKLGRVQAAVEPDRSDSFQGAARLAALRPVRTRPAPHAPQGRAIGRGRTDRGRRGRPRRDVVKSLRRGDETSLSIVVDAMFPTASLVPFAKDFAAEHPSVALVLYTEVLSAVTARVRERRSAWGIAVEDADMTELERRPIADVRLVPVAGRAHPLARLRGPIDAAGLAGAVQIVLGEHRDAADASDDHGVFSPSRR